jgi:photosystem II stability/assembly factor-like uncharacterized protein
MNVNTRMLSSAIMISLLALIGTLYVSVPVANADDIVEEPSTATTEPVNVVFLEPEYGYVVGEDGMIIEEFDNDGSDWISYASPTTEPDYNVVFLEPEYGYVVGEDGMIIEEFDNDGSDWISYASPTTEPDNVVLIHAEEYNVDEYIWTGY